MDNKTKFVLGLKYGLILVVIAILINSANYLVSRLLNLPIEDPNNDSPVMDLLKSASRNPSTFLFIILYITVLAPLVEESIFRWVPIRLTKFFTDSKVVLWSVVVIFSIIFGSLHGDPASMLIAGVAGLLLSNVFLKGGMISSWTAHTFFNSVGVTVALIHMYFFKN